MPYIDVKTSVHLSNEDIWDLKTRLGKDIECVSGKTEAVTMVGIASDYTLFLGGEQLEKCAYVEVKFYTAPTRQDMEELNKAIFTTMAMILEIPPEAIYITYFGQPEWGAKGILL